MAHSSCGNVRGICEFLWGKIHTASQYVGLGRECIDYLCVPNRRLFDRISIASLK